MEVRGYMRFDKDFTYYGLQCEVGGEYEDKDNDNMKFFFYENPFDVLKYNGPVGGRYAVVTGSGAVSHNYSIVEAQRIRIEKEISLRKLIEDGVKYAVDAAIKHMGTRSLVMNSGYGSIAMNYRDWSLAVNIDKHSMAVNTGRHSMAANRGDSSAAVSRGDFSAAITDGHCSVAVCTSDNSAAIVEGKGSIAIALGHDARARARSKCWLVFADWQYSDEDKELHAVDVKTFLVDGDTVKANTFYRCEDGRLVEVG